MSELTAETELAKLRLELVDYKKQVNDLNYQLLNAQEDRSKLRFMDSVIEAAVSKADDEGYDDQCRTALCFVSEELRKYADPLREINKPAPLIVQELKSA